MTDKLRALVEKWREESQRMAKCGDDSRDDHQRTYHYTKGDCLRDCASELSELLPPSAAGEGVGKVLCHRLHQPNYSSEWKTGDYSGPESTQRGWSIERAYERPATPPAAEVDWPSEFVKRMREASESVKVPKMSPMKQELFKAGCVAMIHALNAALRPFTEENAK